MSGFALKIIALITMIIDHTGIAFQFVIDSQNLRAIGRIAFPIYVFLMGEGCRHTKDTKKYLLRLGAFGLLSEVPFDFLRANAGVQPRLLAEHVLHFFDPTRQNVFFTLFLGVLAVCLYENRRGWALRLRTPFLYWPVWIAVLAGEFFHTDYGAAGVLSIVAVWHYREKGRQIFILLLLITYLYARGVTLYHLKLFSGACLALVFIYFYNGKRGPSWKWGFYVMYPLHLIVLGAVWYFILARAGGIVI